MGARTGVAEALCQVRGPAQLSLLLAARNWSEVRGPRQVGPCPSQPTGDKKDAAQEQFMGRKADWIIHCQGHVSQQRWHRAAQKPLPSGWS